MHLLTITVTIALLAKMWVIMTIKSSNSAESTTESFINTLANYERVDIENLRKEVKKLNVCFSNYTPECPVIERSFFAFDKKLLDVVRKITNLGDLTDKVNEEAKSEGSEDQQYFAITKLINSVIYFQYKLNIIRESNETEVDSTRKEFTKKYLSILDKRYKLKEQLLENNLPTQIGYFGNPTLNTN